MVHIIVLWTFVYEIGRSLKMQCSIKKGNANKFYVELENFTMETLVMILEVFGSETIKKCCSGRLLVIRSKWGSVKDKPRAGSPSTSRNTDNVQCIRDVLNSDRRLSVLIIADQIVINKMTTQSIITENLHMRKIWNTSCCIVL